MPFISFTSDIGNTDATDSPAPNLLPIFAHFHSLGGSTSPSPGTRFTPAVHKVPHVPRAYTLQAFTLTRSMTQLYLDEISTGEGKSIPHSSGNRSIPLMLHTNSRWPAHTINNSCSPAAGVVTQTADREPQPCKGLFWGELASAGKEEE